MAEVNESSAQFNAQLLAVLDSIVVDLAATRAQVTAAVADITALDTSIDTLVAKLNLDEGVTDADYAGAAAMTAEDPGDLTTTSD